MGSTIDTIVSLVHERDALLDERRQLTENLDRRIAEVDGRIGRLLGGAVAQPPAPVAVAKTVIERVATEIRQHPGASVGELAAAVYGEDTKKSRHNIRAQVWQLRKTGRYPEPSANGANTMSS